MLGNIEGICYFSTMKIGSVLIFLLALLFLSCYQPRRDCQSFKDGTFSFTSIIGRQGNYHRIYAKGQRRNRYILMARQTPLALGGSTTVSL